MCCIKDCNVTPSPSSKKGYCPEHQREAKQRWLAMIKAKGAASQERKAKFADILSECLDDGQVAFDACKPTPIVVSEHDNPIDDGSPVVKQWVGMEGDCGMARVLIVPANCSFAVWCRNNGYGHTDDCGRGLWLEIAPQTHGPAVQSYERNLAWAHAVGRVLSSHGIDHRTWTHQD